MEVLITGGTSGVGVAAVESLLNAGNIVHFTYCNNTVKAKKLCERFPNARAYRCNFRDAPSVDSFCQQLDGMALDALVNNAFTGKFLERQCHRNSIELYDEVFRDNVLPTIRITHQAITGFKKRHCGKIITILTAGLLGKPPIGSSAYVSAKAFLAQMSRCWATEYIRHGITSNTISPSFMRTNFTADIDARMAEEIANAHPLGRLLDCHDVVSVVEFLLSAPMDVNGVDIPITAGSTMH